MSSQSSQAITRELARFVAETTYADLPQAVIDRMKVYVLDVLAAGCVGARLPWADIVYEMVREEGGRPESTVFGRSERVSGLQAALLNGVMIGGFESEHVGHVSHPAGTVSPAALAVAERQHASGAEFLLAMAMGYEVVCRIGDGQTGAVEIERGFHNPAANGAFSAAAAAGKLFGLSEIEMARAFGVAGSHCGGLTEYAWDGSMTKRLHLGLAARGGLQSAILAAKGFTGPMTIVEGRYGYLHAFSPSPKPEVILAGLGEEWRLETLMIKAYPCHVSCQGVVGAIQQLKRTHAIDPREIKSVHMRSGRSFEERFLNPAPTNALGAQYSVPFTMAVAFFRDLDDPLQYDDSVLGDPEVETLAGKFSWEPDPAADNPASAKLQIVTATESVDIELNAFRGSPANPATFDDAADKFRRYSRHIVAGSDQDKIVSLVQGLEAVDDVSALTGLLRPSNNS